MFGNNQSPRFVRADSMTAFETKLLHKANSLAKVIHNSWVKCLTKKHGERGAMDGSGQFRAHAETMWTLGSIMAKGMCHCHDDLRPLLTSVYEDLDDIGNKDVPFLPHQMDVLTWFVQSTSNEMMELLFAEAGPQKKSLGGFKMKRSGTHYQSPPNNASSLQHGCFVIKGTDKTDETQSQVRATASFCRNPPKI